jgi:hypothetical protein
MNRYFTTCVVILAALAMSPRLGAQQNLQFVLDGPFVVCENQGFSTLTIYVPDLEAAHYPATLQDGIDTGVIEFSYPGGHARYPDFDDQVEIGMTFTYSDRTGLATPSMALMPLDASGKRPSPSFYSEKGYCGSNAPIEQDLIGFKVTVPIPDEVWALNPSESGMKITVPNSNTGLGECNSGNLCPHATEIVLHYLRVDPKSFQLNAKCGGKDCNKAMGLGVGWSSANFAAESIGSEFQIRLTAEPMPTNDPKGHALDAFRAESRLSGLNRDLVLDPNYKAQFPALHVVCQVAPTFICTTRPTNSVPAACPPN